MGSFLDQVISNTSYGPTIISEQHDVSKIDFGGEDAIKNSGSSRPGSNGGGWDAGEYGISLAEAQKRWDDAQTPEAREKLIAELRLRAIRRAGLDTSNGRVNVFVAGRAPWHKLGVNVAEAVNSADAARLSGTDFIVDKLPLSYVDATGTVRTQEDVFGLVRRDTGAFLGNVGNRYKVIQNESAFEFLDSVLGEFGARYESAGSIFGGKKVWALVHLPQQRIVIAGQDVSEAYAIFQNPHDGSGKAFCFPTVERVVCSNTYRIASGERDKGIGLRHTGDIKARIADARVALGLAVSGFDKYAEKAQALVEAKVPVVNNYFDDVLDAVLEVTAAESIKGASALAAALQVTEAERALVEKSFEKKIERRGEILEEILGRYEGEKCGIAGIRGTAWSAYNAISEFADHGKLNARQSKDAELRESRRFESTLIGDADELKQVAFARALDYTRV